MNKFRDNGRNRFLCIECEDSSDIGYEAQMMIHNRPEGLLPLQIFREDDKCYLEYNVSGLVSLQELEKSGDMGLYIFSVLEGMYRLADTLHEYFLNAENLILKADSIFLRRETGNVCFCYFPGSERPLQEMLQELMEYFLRFLNPGGEEDVLLLYGLYRKSREKNVTLKTLFEFWKANRVNSEEACGRGERDCIDTGSLYPKKNGSDFKKPTYKDSVYEILGLEDEKRETPEFSDSYKEYEGTGARCYEKGESYRENVKDYEERGDTGRSLYDKREETPEEVFDYYDTFESKKKKPLKKEIRSFIGKYKVELMIGGVVLTGAMFILFS